MKRFLHIALAWVGCTTWGFRLQTSSVQENGSKQSVAFNPGRAFADYLLSSTWASAFGPVPHRFHGSIPGRMGQSIPIMEDVDERKSDDAVKPKGPSFNPFGDFDLFADRSPAPRITKSEEPVESPGADVESPEADVPVAAATGIRRRVASGSVADDSTQELSLNPFEGFSNPFSDVGKGPEKSEAPVESPAADVRITDSAATESAKEESTQEPSFNPFEGFSNPFSDVGKGPEKSEEPVKSLAADVPITDSAATESAKEDSAQEPSFNPFEGFSNPFSDMGKGPEKSEDPVESPAADVPITDGRSDSAATEPLSDDSSEGQTFNPLDDLQNKFAEIGSGFQSIPNPVDGLGESLANLGNPFENFAAGFGADEAPRFNSKSVLFKLFDGEINASAVAEACREDVVWNDMSKSEPLRGPAAVEALLVSKFPEGVQLTIQRITDGGFSGGFTWFRSADGQKGLRGTLYAEFDETGLLKYVQEGCEPIFKPGEATEKFLKAVTGFIEKPEREPNYTVAEPTTASGIVRYLWEEAYPGGAGPETALELFADDIVYEDFNYPEPFVGKAAVTDFVTAFDIPGAEFKAQKISDGSKSCAFTWKVLVNGNDGPSGISFYEVNSEGKVSYIRDIPAPSLPWDGLLASAAELVNPKLRVFSGGSLE